MKILVTGSSGFIGTNLVDLLGTQHDVIAFDQVEPRTRLSSVRYVNESISDPDAIAHVVRDHDPEVVYHLAARTDLQGATVADYAVNIEGTRHLISAAARWAPRAHLVHASSRLVFAIDHKPSSLFDYKPSTPYGESKVQMEQTIYASDSPNTWTIVRPTSIWGPWFGTPYRDFFDNIRRRTYVHPRGITVRKTFGYVGNAVHQLGVLATMEPARIHRKVLWLADYEPLEVNAWARDIAEALKVPPPVEVPRSVLRALAGMGDLMQRAGWSNVPLTSFRLNNLLSQMIYDTVESESVFGELPYSTREGVLATADWLRKHPQA